MQAATLIRLEGQISWRVTRDSAGSVWIGVCDPLRLTLEADTYAELMESIAESLDAVFREMLKTGDLTQFLYEHGWRPATPIPPGASDVRFDVPFSILPWAASDTERTIHQ